MPLHCHLLDGPRNFYVFPLLVSSPRSIQIDKAFAPKQGVEWAPNYHGTLYNLTDDAIQVGSYLGAGQGSLCAEPSSQATCELRPSWC